MRVNDDSGYNDSGYNNHDPTDGHVICHLADWLRTGDKEEEGLDRAEPGRQHDPAGRGHDGAYRARYDNDTSDNH